MLRLRTSERVSVKDLVLSIEEIAASTTLLSLATINDDGSPHINTAFFARTGIALDMVFVSSPETEHIKNIRRRSTAAATVFSTSQQWDDEKAGLQLFGEITHAEDGADIDVADRAYREAFGAYREWLEGESEETRLAMRRNYYVFRPSSVKVFDEARLGEEQFFVADVVRSE